MRTCSAVGRSERPPLAPRHLARYHPPPLLLAALVPRSKGPHRHRSARAPCARSTANSRVPGRDCTAKAGVLPLISQGARHLFLFLSFFACPCSAILAWNAPLFLAIQTESGYCWLLSDLNLGTAGSYLT
eukprot:2329624-Rhodomonas_salina.1